MSSRGIDFDSDAEVDDLSGFHGDVDGVCVADFSESPIEYLPPLVAGVMEDLVEYLPQAAAGDSDLEDMVDYLPQVAADAMDSPLEPLPQVAVDAIVVPAPKSQHRCGSSGGRPSSIHVRPRTVTEHAAVCARMRECKARKAKRKNLSRKS